MVKKKDTKNYERPKEPHLWCPFKGFVTEVACKECFKTNEVVDKTMDKTDSRPQDSPFCQHIVLRYLLYVESERKC